MEIDNKILPIVLPLEMFNELKIYTMEEFEKEKAHPTLRSRIPNTRGRVILTANERRFKGDTEKNIIGKVHDYLLPFVRDHFNDQTLLPTKGTVGIYSGRRAELQPHIDDDAAEYSFNMVIHKEHPWPLEIDGHSFDLEENQGVFFRGNHQYHGRPPFLKPETNVYASSWFYYCPPDHWYFTHGPDFLYLKRGVDPEKIPYLQ